MKIKKTIVSILYLILNINIFSVENQNLQQLIFWENQVPFFGRLM